MQNKSDREVCTCLSPSSICKAKIYILASESERQNK